MRITVGGFFLVLSLAAYRVPAQELLLESSLEADRLFITAELDCDCGSTVQGHLDDGMEAGIVFQVRLYEETRGFSSLWGGRIIEERIVTYSGRKDPFERTYILTTGTGDTRTYRDGESFIDGFFTMENSAFSIPSADRKYYLLARVHLDPVKLVPPLNLIALFRRLGIATDWKKIPIGGGRGN